MHKHLRIALVSLFFFVITGADLRAGEQENSTGAVPPPAEAIEAWRSKRLGLFVHWGPVSLKGTEIGWSRGREVTKEEYDGLYRNFNPVRFDADRWASVARDAGLQYLVLTSKHHDGFCLWDSKYTDYDIMATPFKRDVMKELADACRRHNISFCTYHSICDWRHPDYPTDSPGGKRQKPRPDMERYVRFLHNQLQEIIENYGPLGIMWFDGEWEEPWTHEMGVDLYKHVRRLQSDILINNRVDKGRRGMEGSTKSAEFLGDYDTPEQRVGAFNRDKPWESCITICRQWAWKPDDRLKSRTECIQTLLRVVGGDGNLLLNVGPMPDGRIEARQEDRLREIGLWLKRYGKGVYSTRGGPFQPGRWGASTCRDREIYLFVMQWPEKGALKLPSIPATIERVETLSGGQAKVTASQKATLVELDAADRDPCVSVIRLTTSQRAFDIPPVKVTAAKSDH